MKILQAIEATHKQVLRSRVFIALHMHAGDGNVHTNIPVNSDDYAMLQEAAEAVARVMRLAVSLGGVVSGEHGIGITKLEFLDRGENRGVPRLQGNRRSRRPLQQGQAPSRQRSPQRLHAELLADRRGKSHPRAIRHRPHRGHDQELPALRQMQAGVHDARAARESALQPAQQDSRDQSADRSIPLRRADAPRHLAPALRRVRRRRGPLHGLSQVREPVSGRHRFRRRLDRDAQLPAGATASGGRTSVSRHRWLS